MKDVGCIAIGYFLQCSGHECIKRFTISLAPPSADPEAEWSSASQLASYSLAGLSLAH